MSKVIRCQHIVSKFGLVCNNVIGVKDSDYLIVCRKGRKIKTPLSDEKPVEVVCEFCGGITRIYSE